MVILDELAIFRSYIELGAIARQSVKASREVISAYFGNIGRNSGYFLLSIFSVGQPNEHTWWGGFYPPHPQCAEPGGRFMEIQDSMGLITSMVTVATMTMARIIARTNTASLPHLHE